MSPAVPSLSNFLGQAILRSVLFATQRRHHRLLLERSKAPQTAQGEILKSILAVNAGTDFGRRHGFSQIKDIGDYRAAVPAQTYEDLRPLIERQELTGEKCLTFEQPVFYHRTSGTVGEPKNIPVTTSGLERIRQHQRLSAYAQSKGSGIFHGKMFGITGQAIEGAMPGGTPFGSASGLIYESHSRFLRSRYVLPAALSSIADYEARYLAMAVYGLAEASVSCIATANPSTLVKLLSVINQNPDEILGALAAGRLPDRVPADWNVGREFVSSASRVRHLAGKLESAGRLTYKDIWPNLRGVVTWTGGSCKVPLRNLTGSLPADCKIIELGYLASEVRGTINIDGRRNACLPTFLDTFFEFVDRRAWEAGDVAFQSLHELEVGREYYVFVTTADGLYRYDMNDVMRVADKVNQTPVLDFVQKGKGITNITGEKLHEAQVLEAVMTVLAERRIDPDFFIMLADQETAAYTLFLEAEPLNPGPDFSEEFDRCLRSANIEYDSKRASGRLAPVTIRWLRTGTGDRYRASSVAKGQRDAQFKYLHLQYAHECAFDFDAFSEPG